LKNNSKTILRGPIIQQKVKSIPLKKEAKKGLNFGMKKIKNSQVLLKVIRQV
jgi:hypothetical protein